MNNKSLIGVFEEDLFNFKLLESILKKSNFEVDRISDLKALEEIALGRSQVNYSLVFTNLYFHDKIRNAVRNESDIPFIAFTTSSSEEICSCARDLNYSKVILKPYEIDYVRFAVQVYAKK